MSSLQVACAVFIFSTTNFVRKKKATIKTLVAKAVVQNEFCVQCYWIFSRFYVPRSYWTVQTNSETPVNLVSHKILKRGARFRAAIPFQERLAVALQFLHTDNSCIRLQ
jgi:hypothetical protein